MIFDNSDTLSEIFKNSPVASAILDAKDLRLVQANDAVLDLWGRNDTVIGSKLLEFIPEIVDQPYPKLLQQVLREGEGYKDSNALVLLNRKGVLERVYIDFSYTPIKSKTNKTMGILILATDVSYKQLSKLALQENDRNLRNIVMSAPVAMCIFKGPAHKVECVNERMLDLWASDQSMGLRILQYVYQSGLPYTNVENNISYTYTPLRDGIGKPHGVVLIANKL